MDALTAAPHRQSIKESMMRADREIQSDVEAELKWVPDVDESDIVVDVVEGIVTLRGFVPHHLDRFHAENAARRVVGCAGVVNEIRVRRSSGESPTDGEISRSAVTAIALDMPDLANSVQVLVSDGQVRLEGAVDWQWQRSRIESTVRAIKGVSTVSNLLAIRPHSMAEDVKQRIEAAFRRSAVIDAGDICVEAHDDTVFLTGTVHSLHEKGEAERTAWSAPGVTGVVNQITVMP